MPHDHHDPGDRSPEAEPPSVDALLQEHLPGLRAFVRLRVSKAIRDRESSSDLVQSVCREVLEGADRFDYRGDAAFRAWLFATALSKVRDRARFHTADRRDVGREAEVGEDARLSALYANLGTPSRAAMSREELQRIEAAFDELPDDYREVITLTKIAGMTYLQAGAQMGRSEGAVRGLLERALTRLSWILSR